MSPPGTSGGLQAVTPTSGDLAAATAPQATPVAGPLDGLAGWDDREIIAAYRTQYGSLVCQAAQVVRDLATAEDVVQDSFIAMYRTRPRLADNAKTLAYLRQSVLNRSRSVLRHREVADRHPRAAAPDVPSAEDSALARLEHSAMISVLNLLAPRQRQVLTLRYVADMSQAQVAAELGISMGAVKSHTTRGLTSLRPVLQSHQRRDEECHGDRAQRDARGTEIAATSCA